METLSMARVSWPAQTLQQPQPFVFLRLDVLTQAVPELLKLLVLPVVGAKESAMLPPQSLVDHLPLLADGVGERIAGPRVAVRTGRDDEERAIDWVMPDVHNVEQRCNVAYWRNVIFTGGWFTAVNAGIWAVWLVSLVKVMDALEVKRAAGYNAFAHDATPNSRVGRQAVCGEALPPALFLAQNKNKCQ